MIRIDMDSYKKSGQKYGLPSLKCDKYECGARGRRVRVEVLTGCHVCETQQKRALD